MISRIRYKYFIEAAAQGWKCRAWLSDFFQSPIQTIYVESRLNYNHYRHQAFIEKCSYKLAE